MQKAQEQIMLEGRGGNEGQAITVPVLLVTSRSVTVSLPDGRKAKYALNGGLSNDDGCVAYWRLPKSEAHRVKQSIHQTSIARTSRTVQDGRTV